MPAPILQDRLPHLPWTDPATARLPGVQPCAPGDWVRVDEVYGPQMALRRQLLMDQRADVVQVLPQARPAVEELADLLTTRLAKMPGFAVTATQITCPDGHCQPRTPITLAGLGALVQEDLCLLQQDARGAWVLTAAVLCFPASWRLAEKIGRPLAAIHDPVPAYTGDLARRVDRLFNAVRPDRPLWRMNILRYADPTLYQPRSAASPRPEPGSSAGYIRSERQCILHLPETNARLFSIHTYVVAAETVTHSDLVALDRHIAAS